MKMVPVAIEEFSELIEKDYYYVDKTKAIEDLEKSQSKVVLFTRPRRFGKSLFLSTLDSFYNLENKNKKLFNNLYISKSKYFKSFGLYPVIRLSMKNIISSNYEGMLEDFRDQLIPFINKIKKFKKLTELDMSLIKRIQDCNESALSHALEHFTRFYYQNYNIKTIILIDEYESPLLNSFIKGFYEQALNFFQSLYTSAFKSNIYLEKVILTGITQLTHANIFSQLNNLEIYTYEMEQYADTFGFTSSDVSTLLKYYNLDKYKDAVKEYYDGYIFGKYEIYNPWSILQLIKNDNLKFYWTNSISIKIFTDLLAVANKQIKQDYLNLLSGKTIKLSNTDPNKLTISDLKKPEKLFSYMIATGYLNYNYNTQEARIVNKEILYALTDLTSQGLYQVPEDYINFIDSLRAGILDKIEYYLNSILKNSTSYWDLNSSSSEINYHLSLINMLYGTNLGEISSNQVSGDGRYDILIKNILPTGYSYLFEVKVVKDESNINKALENGLAQIKTKGYTKALDGCPNKVIMALCFCKRSVKIKYEILK